MENKKNKGLTDKQWQSVINKIDGQKTDTVVHKDICKKIVGYSEGDKIAWSSVVNGKITRINGKVSSIVGETMCCIGQCIATGNWWRDYISIHDKSISRL